MRFQSFAPVRVLAMVASIIPFTANDAHAAPPKAGRYVLPVNLDAYATEYYLEGKVMVGNCGAACVVNVEAQLNGGKSIAADAVKKKSESMVKTFKRSKDRQWYIHYITDLASQFKTDGFVVGDKYTKERKQAGLSIYEALSGGRFVVVVSWARFDATPNVGHFYPIYGGSLVYDKAGNIDEAKSTVTAIETDNGKNEASRKTLTVSLKAALDSMKSVSTSSTYNIIDVAKKK